MRRIATVTSSVPLAACACCITSRAEYLPVPTISLDLNSCDPIFNRSCIALTARNGLNHFNGVAVFDAIFAQTGPRHDGLINRHRDTLTLRKSQLLQHLGKRDARLDFSLRAVDRNGHRPARVPYTRGLPLPAGGPT